MDYQEAADVLVKLLEEAANHNGIAAKSLEIAGAVHTEALLASLEAYNRAARLAGASTEDAPEKKFTDKGAELQPMPEEHVEIDLDFPLTAEQFAILQAGDAPVDEFERWFLECDGMHIRYYRNVSGFCFFDAVVEPQDGAYVVKTVTVNQNDKQYTESNPGVCAAQMKILLANNLGLDDEPYWDEMDIASDSEN